MQRGFQLVIYWGIMPDGEKKMIKGYRELTEKEIDVINDIKDVADLIGRLIDSMEKIEEFDQRWVAIAKTDLQKGFMSAVRAIAQPTSF